MGSKIVKTHLRFGPLWTLFGHFFIQLKSFSKIIIGDYIFLKVALKNFSNFLFQIGQIWPRYAVISLKLTKWSPNILQNILKQSNQHKIVELRPIEAQQSRKALKIIFDSRSSHHKYCIIIGQMLFEVYSCKCSLQLQYLSIVLSCAV